MENKVLIYISEDGLVKVDVNIIKDTVWLSLDQISELFDRDKSVISRHIKNIFSENELEENSVIAFFATTASDGKEYNVKYFNLDVIISVGYRVKSKRGTQFRLWANNVLKEYMQKGFALDDRRLKNNGANPYFEELLARIRDIRSSEKVFWRKVLDIFSTSIDYNPKDQICIDFFKTVQNKMHWAAHGHTAAEVIFERVDSNKNHLGLTNFSGDEPTKQETEIAKNYLSNDELNILNRMVSGYLDVAEINALSQHPMKMKDWVEEIDSFLKMTRKDILNHKGTISHQEALNKAHKEYEKYMLKTLTTAEKDYLSVLENLEKKK